MKFTEEKLEAAFTELLGQEGFPHHLGISIARKPEEVLIEEDEQQAQSEYRKSGDAESHDKSAGEGDIQGPGQRSAGGLRGANVGFGRDAHSDETGQCTEDAADHEGEYDQDVRGLNDLRQNSQRGTGNHHIDGQDPVLCTQKGHGAFGDGGGDALHLGITGILRGYPLGFQGHIQKTDDTQNRYDVQEIFHFNAFLKGCKGKPSEQKTKLPLKVKGPEKQKLARSPQEPLQVSQDDYQP